VAAVVSRKETWRIPTVELKTGIHMRVLKKQSSKDDHEHFGGLNLISLALAIPFSLASVQHLKESYSLRSN
jgi:hypothetical protein